MKRTITVLGITGVVAAFMSTMGTSQEKTPRSPEDMAKLAEAMQKAQRYISPGEHHEVLKKFLGEWKTESRFFMGTKPTPAEPGETKTRWLVEGRWLISESKGQLMGRPFESYSIIGYDNFKMSYVITTVSSWDTAMNRVEGDMTRDGRSMLLYGTLDEYLTGEHDKMVKLAYRFKSNDKMTMEIHDLPIGETNTKVVEVTYTRK